MKRNRILKKLLLVACLLFAGIPSAQGNTDELSLYHDNFFRWFMASGWMGDVKDLAFNSASTENPYSGKTCVKVHYNAKMSYSNGWAGIYWQYPVNNWGALEGRHHLKGMGRLTFFARGQNGGEKMIFRVGGIVGPKHGDSDTAVLEVVLTPRWKQYQINLAGKDLSHIIGGFNVTAKAKENPDGATIYLDDIVFTQ
ncbi:MAG TPA: hypothetical protein DD723_04620 [Candidatus Omnitrophica bacterium]|nr:MAG: hypothetical protein A2Z81_04120 [Omnitrophica WOR_2 bacterium GWA2_45_18]HBR14813.1 hypothetical protein [Candidatus Omnitrophota bacterium]